METIHQKNDFNKFNNYTLFIVKACQGNICFLTKKSGVWEAPEGIDSERGGNEDTILQSTFIHSQSEI